MNVICPRCGKENTTPFSDTVFHTHGYECADCKKDFGVDDGKTFSEWEKELNYFEYERVHKDKTKKKLVIAMDEKTGHVMLSPTIVYPNRMMQPIEPQDITESFDVLKQLIFEKLFILDWDRISVGLLLGQDESYSIRMKFTSKPEISYSGTNRFPPYLKVLEQLFSSFFELA